MKQADRISLLIEPENQSVRMDSCTEGVHSSKLIGLDELTQCFINSLQTPAIHSGLLPPNCLSYSEGEKDWRQISLLFPERQWDFTYHKTTYTGFPLPRMVFRFSFYRGKRIESVHVGVIDQGRITPHTKMYRYPFSNVNGYKMCTGVNMLPRYDDIHGMSTLPYLITSMPNNDDYYTPRNNQKKAEYRELLELLKDKDQAFYYSDILIPNGDTLGKFLTMN